MHRSGTTYELGGKPTRFQEQTNERAKPVDGHCVDVVDDSRRASPYTPYARITSHLRTKGDLTNIKDPKESNKNHQEISAILQAPLGALKASHPDFEAHVQGTVSKHFN